MECRSMCVFVTGGMRLGVGVGGGAAGWGGHGKYCVRASDSGVHNPNRSTI